MRKVSGKKRDMENGDKVDAIESDTEEVNGVEEDADPLATAGENGDDEPAEAEANASDAEPDAEEQDEEEDEDKPLKSSKKSGKKEKKAAKKAAKKKKGKKRVSLNVPADKHDPEDDDDDEEEEEYEVQDIVDHRYSGKKLEYKIRWKGYSAKDDTWEAKNSLSCPEIIKKYEANQKKSPAKRKAGKPGRGRPASKKARKEESEEEEDEDDEDDDKEYEVARLLDVRTRKGKREFLVHWKGWSARFDNWEPEENLNCGDLISAFDDKLAKAKNASQKELRAAPKTTKRLAADLKHKGARISKRGGGRTRVTYYDDE